MAKHDFTKAREEQTLVPKAGQEVEKICGYWELRRPRCRGLEYDLVNIAEEKMKMRQARVDQRLAATVLRKDEMVKKMGKR